MPRYLYQSLADDAPDDLKRQHHAELLLGSDDFTVDLLRPFVPSGARGTKREMALVLAEEARRDPALCERIFLSYARHPKTWLTLVLGDTPNRFAARPPAEFITHHGASEDCFGPVEAGSSLYYICTRSVPQWILDTASGQASRRYLRWSCVVQMTKSWLAIHWDNISYREEKDGASQRIESQYPYWNEVPNVVGFVEGKCNTKYRAANLFKAVLTGAWNKYEGQPGSDWTHEKIRADAHGVALSASGRKQEDIEIDASGVQALTQTLAHVAVQELGAAPERTPAVARRMLHTLIHEWNPKSYQFRLDRPADGDDQQFFRGHVYFGTGHFSSAEAASLKRSGPDGLAHVKSFVDYGGSVRALSFLLQFIGET